MLENIRNENTYLNDDEQNYQNIFNSMYDKEHIGYGLRSKVSSNWLKKYHHILK